MTDRTMKIRTQFLHKAIEMLMGNAPRRHSLNLVAILFVSLLVSSVKAQEISYLEDFALAQDRAKALEKLVPGTEAYYYYHCLHYLNTEQFAEAEQLLKPWIERFGETSLVQQIQNRHALLTYSQRPQATLDHLRRRMNLHFNHQRQIPAAQRGLPTQLDQNLISFPTLLKQAMASHQGTEGIEDIGLIHLQASELNDRQLRHFLQRLQLPDVQDLPQLIERDLQNKNAKAFGSYTIHSRLTLTQLDELLKLRPTLLNQQNFVNIYLTKLEPSNDVDLNNDTQEMQSYLDRLWGFVSKLNATHNSLKACVLYRRLDFDRHQGTYDRERFTDYLKFPRQVYYINPRLIQRMRSSAHMVNLHADYRQQIRLIPIVNDEPLVRDYLHRFLLDENDYQEFLPWISDQFLKRQFATVKILNGLGDTERWASMLTPEEYQQLMKRIDLDFDRTNPDQFAVDQAVELELYTKNIKNLIVKVFEINTTNYYRRHLKEIDTDINLDGLVPNWQESYQYTDSPFHRVKRSFRFDEIDREGVYVIDFIGSGKSSRALIRKGQLHHIVETTLAGPKFTILDGNGRKVNGARIWVAGREFTPSEDGTITIPFSTQPKRERVVISRGSLSSLGWFVHPSEQYQLNAGIFVDRESLLRAGKANIVIRPQLRLSGTPVSLKLLTDISLVINATDLDDVSSSKEVKSLELNESNETAYEFQVPARLHRIQFTLSAKVKNVSQDVEQTIAANQSFEINAIDESDAVQDVHLLQTEDGYRIAIRGKTGEAREGQPLLLVLKHRLFTQPVHASLRSDEAGRVFLGPLVDINSIEARLANNQAQVWQLKDTQQSAYGSVHALAGQAIEIPFANDAESTRESLALYEKRRNTLVQDHFESMNLREGLITITDLQPGDYELHVKNEKRVVQIRVTEGHQQGSFAMGSRRNLELRGGSPLHVQSIETGNETIQIKLGGSTEFARVHVFATRFEPRFDEFPVLASVGDVEPVVINRGHLQSTYVAGRDIGEEYQYILDRQYASKYPGVMLTRPTMLLNPWAIRTTDNTVQVAAKGDEFSAAGGATDSEAQREDGPGAGPASNADFSNLDFLANGTITLLGLQPDENGVVSIDRESLGDKHMVRIVVQDPYWTLQREVILPDEELVFRDLRLSDGLDPDLHFAQRKAQAVLPKDELFELTNMLSSKFQHYDDLGDVYRVFMTLSGNQQLAEFGFLLRWPSLSAEEKYELYTKYACHELHFFLLNKDREFFDSVVVPYLANKIDATFMDRWLLQNDLAEFAKPWEFRRLNTVEQALLGRRLTEHRAQLQRRIEDSYQLNPSDIQFVSHLYDVTLKSGALETEGIYGAFQRAEEDSVRLLRELSKSKKDDARVRFNQQGVASVQNLSLPAEEAMDALSLGVELQVQPNNRASGRGRARTEGGQGRGGRRTPSLGRNAAKPGAGGGGGFQPEADFENGETRFDDKIANEKEHFYKQADKNLAMRKQIQQFYRRLKPTQEWVENNYYHLPIEQQDANLVLVNRFWREFARHDDEQPFLSPYFAEASGNFTEMMLALAVLDLPFEAPEHELDFVDNQMRLTPASDIIAFYQQIRPAVFDRRGSDVLVSENFFRKDDRYRMEDGKQFDKFVTEEFLTHTLYGGQVVITNPTSTPQSIDLLVQIPNGSLAASGSQETRNVKMDLQAFSSQTMEYFFYFPGEGQFTHYPAHVSIDDRVTAVADPLSFKVVREPSEVDTTSWEFVSQNGTDEQVLDFLRNENLQSIDLSRIAFRMKEKTFFQQVTELVQSRFAYDHTLWSYSIKHNHVDTMRQFLKYSDPFVAQCGKYLQSEILSIEPVARLWYEHREFWPLVNARAHQLGSRRTILNDRIWQQYHALLGILSCKNDLNDDEHLAVAYYLLLQDRVAEGLGHFEQVDRDNLVSRLQYDYCHSYVAMTRSQPAEAAKIAQAYQQHPVKRWRDLFAAVLAQVEEIQSGAPTADNAEDQAAKQTALARQTPSFDFDVESRQTKIQFQNLKSIVVNYYKMDIELLFSRNPFVQQQNDGFAMIRPNQSESYELPDDRNEFVIDLPDELKNSNVLVEITAAGMTKSKAYYAHSLNVQLIEQYGQLQVTHTESSKPLSKVYIKVYAKKADGSVHFYKDGYTDLRGRFDYTSLSNQNLDDVQRFSMLVLSDDHGAVVREASIPKE